jgi:DNA primase
MPKQMAKAQAAPITLPPVIFGITERLWKERAPWPLIPYKLVKKYGWYISMLHGREYLIMPIIRKKESVFYSARLLGELEGAKKYDYPKGATKTYWQSKTTLSNPVFLAEGVADAAYLSQLGSSVGLLGNYYDGSLDEQLKNKHVIIVLDGDAVGFVSAVRILKYLHKVTLHASILRLPDGKDPTDIELPKLKKLIKEQT